MHMITYIYIIFISIYIYTYPQNLWMHLCLRKHLQKNQNNNNAVGPSWRSFTCDSMWSKTNFTGVGIPPVSVILKITLKYLFVITCPVIGRCSIRTFIIFTHTMVNLSCREQTCHATRVFHTACSSSQWAQLNPTKRIRLFWYFFSEIQWKLMPTLPNQASDRG